LLCLNNNLKITLCIYLAYMSNLFIYSLSDFNEIKNDGFNYVLPDKTIRIINKISKQVGSPGYIKTPIFRKNNKKRGNINDKNIKIQASDWKNVRNFHKTKINKYTELIEKHINEIRNNLNKITDKTYTCIKEEIMDKLEDIKEYMNEEYYIRLLECFIETGMSNKFYSKLYSHLLKDLIIYDNTLTDYIDIVTNKMRDKFDSVEIVSAEEDYDKFCYMNQLLESEISYYVFLSHLSCSGIYSYSMMKKNIDYILSSIETGLSSNTITLERLNQCINIIFNVVQIIQNDENNKNMIPELKIVERMKSIMSLYKKNKLITRKILIKIMELLEKIS